MGKNIYAFIETMMVAGIGGYIFQLLHIPLPWVLGALLFVMLWQGVTKRKAYLPASIRNCGFLVLGIYFGLYFTKETFQTVVPYLLPYLILTVLLVAFSISLGVIVSRWIEIDKKTSIFSVIPGGLSEMAIASEQMKANASLVVIFQTIRMVTVLFTIPPIMTLLFQEEKHEAIRTTTEALASTSIWGYLWFLIPALAAFYLKNRVPAGIIIGALGVTALMNISAIDLPQIPPHLMNGAQVLVGAGIGKNILFQDVKKGGRYSFLFFGLSTLIIGMSLALGLLLSRFTSLDVQTAVLGMAPGGFFEMVITAYTIGGDPAIVSAFQLIRILIIVIVVPSVLRVWFSKEKQKGPSKNEA